MPERDTVPPIGEERTTDTSYAQVRRDDICGHIFAVSATLVGVCLTVVGMLRAVSRFRDLGTIAEELLSIDAAGYLVSCVIAYAALRTTDAARRRRLERYADTAFLMALVLMTAACVVIAWELL